VVADSTALAKAVRGTAPSAGERRMAALSGGVGQSAYPGAWGAEKSNQVQQFNGWLSSCVRYKARLVGTCPRAVRMGKTAEKDKDRSEYKRLTKAYHAGAVSAPPARRKWLGVPCRKAAVSPDKARDAEELEHLDDDHDLSRLLADPNGPDVGLVFWPYFASFFYLCGESFIWKVRDEPGGVSEMWVLPAHWVTPRSDGQRFFAEYEVRAWGASGGMETIDAEDVIHWRSPGLSHPAAPFSEAQAASAVIDTQAMIQWVRYSLLQNGAQIGGVLELPEGMSDISDTAMNRLLAKFQGQFSGVWNSGRPLIVPGGGSYTHPPADLELALGGSEDQARRNVMAAFGLDETLMGFSDEATYAGTAVTWKRLRKSIVEPDQRVLAAVLTERLAAEFGDEYAVIFPDEGGMEDPAEKRANWQAAMQHPAGPAVTLNEVRVELLGLEPSDEEAADDLFGSPGLVPLDQMGAMNDLSGMLGEGGGVMGQDSPEGFGLADDFMPDDPDDPDDGEPKNYDEWAAGDQKKKTSGESHPGPPPRPGLVFDKTKHRWVRPDLPDIDHEDHPANRVVPNKPSTDEEIAQSMHFREQTKAVIDEWVANGAAHLPEAQRDHYAESLQKCFDWMPSPIAQQVIKNTSEINFYKDTNEVTAAIKKRGAVVSDGARVGGFWALQSVDRTGSLHIDGGSDTDEKYGGLNTREVYAHELGHALDAHYRYSNQPGWKKAWSAEIDKDDVPLSKYARRDSHEGFAEYHRLMNTAPKIAKTEYPQCWEYMKSKGLL
jgi:phage portal protein BeeE